MNIKIKIKSKPAWLAFLYTDYIQSTDLVAYLCIEYSNFMEETAAKHDSMSDITLLNPSEFRIADGIVFIGLKQVKRQVKKPVN